MKKQTGKKTLYVHIGMAKTGTTALQSFLWDNRELLMEQGCCYPGMRCAYPDTGNVNERRNGHFLINDVRVNGSLEHKELDEAMYRTGMDEVVRLFGEYDKIVLSDESIWASTYRQRANLWKELRDDSETYGFSVKVIVYLRRQDQYMMSLYRQKVARRKNEGCQKTWEEFITHISGVRQLDYFKKLERIRKVLGRDAMIVCRYERGSFYNNDLYADFLHRIGLELTDGYRIEGKQTNRSLLGNTVEMKRILNGIPDFNSDDDFVIREILYAGSEISKNRVGAELFSKEEAEAFLKKYEQSNERVARTYFGDGKPLFDTTVKELPKYDPNNPYMLEDVLRFAAIGLKYLRMEQAELKRQIRQLQKQTEQIGSVRKELYATRDKLHHPIRTLASRITKS